ncbi:hypothetical protein FHX82_003859 [Amycolatopsis bartoniae]|uniref:Peptidase inhibitor family I36 n=1 Tax=Amycolatopsis bartoniae TaxID=941986 RepID=A0A8H9IZ92_9PSEU|nr:hypothetical protein [Amycolatopsis bartoniae]MBB2936795.1 hypothetical protein [Amycolatopsis bartoniae]TVT09159.1 hypothetical protein FNH07_09670 [Amycolatopsis bartoniae]GHF50179.1 hypothetical protein GCM10017566_24110 [Amycolatopsis bartoniae]
MGFRKTAATMAAVAVAALATGGTAAAAGSGPGVACPAGYLCLVPSSGAPVETVPSGESRAYSPPLVVRALVNNTTLNYCIFSEASFGLPPQTSVTRTATVRAVEPGTVCPL